MSGAVQATTGAPTTGSSFDLAEPVITSFHIAGANTFLSIVLPESLTGTFEGTCSETLDIVIHGGVLSTFTGLDDCDGVFTGRGGRVGFRLTGSGTPDLSSIHGQFVVFAESSSLAGLHGVGAFFASDVGAGYSGTNHFD